MPCRIKRRNTGIARMRKFNVQTRKLIYTALKAEIPIKRSVALAGINISTYREWMRRGLDNDYPVHATFRRKIQKILAEIEMKKLLTIQNAAKGYLVRDKIIKVGKRCKTEIIKIREVPPDWRASAWFLERRFPESYKKPTLHQIPEVNAYELASNVKASFYELMKTVLVTP